MKRIIAIGFKDVNVSEGFLRLLQVHPDSVVVIPIMNNPEFIRSVVQSTKLHDLKYHLFFSEGGIDIDEWAISADDLTICANPVKEVVKSVTSEDIIAFSWDDSIESHVILHSVEDFGVETWNVDGGLQPIEIDHDEPDSTALYQDMQEKLSDFIESFSTYLIAGLLDTITEVFKTKLQEDSRTKDIDPFNP